MFAYLSQPFCDLNDFNESKVMFYHVSFNWLSDLGKSLMSGIIRIAFRSRIKIHPVIYPLNLHNNVKFRIMSTTVQKSEAEWRAVLSPEQVCKHNFLEH